MVTPRARLLEGELLDGRPGRKEKLRVPSVGRCMLDLAGCTWSPGVASMLTMLPPAVTVPTAELLLVTCPGPQPVMYVSPAISLMILEAEAEVR